MDFMSTAQLLGNLGEFFGAIAVVATLVYLAAQIRQNTKAQEDSRQAVVAQSARDIDLYIGNWHLALARDPELKRIMQASQSYEHAAEELEDSEWFEIHCLAASLFMAFQAQHRHQVLQVAHGDQSDYQLGIAKGMSTNLPLWKQWWDQQRTHRLFAHGFIDAIDEFSGPVPDMQNVFPDQRSAR